MGVRTLIGIINSFAQIDFPGTEIPVIYMLLAPAVIYFLWVVVLKMIIGFGKDGSH